MENKSSCFIPRQEIYPYISVFPTDLHSFVDAPVQNYSFSTAFLTFKREVYERQDKIMSKTTNSMVGF